MCYHVSLEVSSLCAGVFTLLAAEGLLTSMCLHVCLEVTRCCEYSSTLFAAERLFSSMNKHVPFQMGSRIAGDFTHIATMGIFGSFLHDGL